MRDRGWALLALAGLYLLLHPYLGIDGDACIYVGRALANLDPNGIGRDLMFVHDGQSNFSLFPIALQTLVAWFGPARAALAITILGVVAWFCAAAALAGRLGTGHARSAILAAMVVLPSSYGQPGVFRVGEALAVPRTLAEAFVLASLAAHLSRRRWLGGGYLALACLIHPIMGLAGLAVLILALMLEDARWLAVTTLAVCAAVTASLLGLPLFDRLLQGIDPDFLDILRARCAELFPSYWPAETWGSICIQAASLLIAATLVASRERQMLLAALMAGICGVAVTFVFGDHWLSLLVVQMQPWRFLWILAVLGGASFGICIAVLLRGTPAARTTLALLALGWVFADELSIVAGAGGLAVAVHCLDRYGLSSVSRRIMMVVWSLVGLLIAVRVGLEMRAVAWIFQTRMDGTRIDLRLFRNFAMILPLVALGCLAWAHAVRRPTLRAFMGVGLALTVFCLWDQRSPINALIEEGRATPELMQAIAGGPGEVLWLDGGAEPWLALGRPSWNSTLQGASIVFSRPLAMAWGKRINRLIALGLAADDNRAPFAPPGSVRPERLPDNAVADLCAHADAPAWIVVPLAEGQVPPAHATLFSLPAPSVKPIPVTDGLMWRRVATLGLLPCRG